MSVLDKDYCYFKLSWACNEEFDPHLGTLAVIYYENSWCYGRFIDTDSMKIGRNKNGILSHPSDTVLSSDKLMKIIKPKIIIDDLQINRRINILQKVNKCLVIEGFQNIKLDVK